MAPSITEKSRIDRLRRMAELPGEKAADVPLCSAADTNYRFFTTARL